MSDLSSIDLFCGAGGLSAGFVPEGYDVALGIDNDEAACETFAENFSDARVEHADLLTYQPEDARNAVGRDIDVILGGPSCQPFSTHGRKERWVVGDPRSDLWSRMHSFVDVLRPRAFIMENVPGMLYYNKGTFVDSLSAAFGDLGYTLNHQILLAADYNLPQLRRRLIVVGMLGDQPFEFPKGPRLGGWRRDSLAKWERKRVEGNLLPHVTLRDALSGLPQPAPVGKASRYTRPTAASAYDAYMRTPWRSVPSQGAGDHAEGRARVTDHEEIQIIDEVSRLAQHVPKGGTWRDIPPHLLPDRFRSMRRTDSTNLYGRMVWDRPAYTMTTQFQNITTGCFIHPDKDRPLTIREGARIQSFSDDFVFRGATTAKARLIGNAVPPLLARSLARELRHQLEGNQVTPKPLVVGSELYRGRPLPGAAETALLMRGARSHDSGPVAAVSAFLADSGIEHQTSVAVEGTDIAADLVLPERRTVVFIQGCFIYGCPVHARQMKSQDVWWKKRIAAGSAKRAEEIERLEADDWTVVTVWEHEDPADLLERLLPIAAA